MWERRLDDPEWRIDVGFHRGVEILARDIEHRTRRFAAGLRCRPDIQPAKPLDGVGDEFEQNASSLQIARKREALRPSLDQRDDLLRIRLLGRKIVDRDIGAFPRVSDRRRPPHAGVAAGNKRLSALQTT